MNVDQTLNVQSRNLKLGQIFVRVDELIDGLREGRRHLSLAASPAAKSDLQDTVQGSDVS